MALARWVASDSFKTWDFFSFNVSVALERGREGCATGLRSCRGILGEESKGAEEVGALPRGRCLLGCAKLDGSSGERGLQSGSTGRAAGENQEQEVGGRSSHSLETCRHRKPLPAQGKSLLDTGTRFGGGSCCHLQRQP